jgi:hypothetical protein
VEYFRRTTITDIDLSGLQLLREERQVQEMTDLIHGRASTYNNHKCRCEDCKAAWADYMRDRVKKWRRKQKQEKQKGTKINL